MQNPKTDGLPVIAICYDFDKTLSPKDMQEFGLIPKLNCSVQEFWQESNALSKECGMDRILAYMQLIITKSRTARVKVSKEDFNALGKDIRLFPGVDTWFKRLKEFAAAEGVRLEHYIISAGLQEIIEGTPIAGEFAGIYASSFYYGPYGEPVWPCRVVNYTTKTQYLFRISKNCLDLSDESSVNEYIGDQSRRIPFRNFIYIGDSETDIPAMKIVKNGGGTAIGVYNAETANLSKVCKLLKQNRIDFLMPALYTEGGRLERLVKDTVLKIKAQEALNGLNKKQNEYVDTLLGIEELLAYNANLSSRDGEAERELNKKKREIIALIKGEN